MMSEAHGENAPRQYWIGYWSMILLQTQNSFNDKLAQFILIPLAGVVAVHYPVESIGGILISLPFILFAPLTGWLSDRFSKQQVMLGCGAVQVVILAALCGALFFNNLPLALIGFFALATQSSFLSPAKIGITKELVGSSRLGFAVGIQQMTSMLAMLAGQILAGAWFDARYKSLHHLPDGAWQAALLPMGIVALVSLAALPLFFAIPKVPAQGGGKFTGELAIRHFSNLASLWKVPNLRRASLGVGFFWGFAAFLNLWSVKLAKALTGGGEGFGTLSSQFMAAASLGMAAGFGTASFLNRRKIVLGWSPLAAVAMMIFSLVLVFLTPASIAFFACLGLLAFVGALFLVPINAWMQDAYPAEKRGELQAAVNLQDCLAGVLAVALIEALTLTEHALGISTLVGFRIDILIVGLFAGVMGWLCLRALPRDVVQLLSEGLLRAVYRIRVVHAERIPATGGALLLPNHVTFADAFFIASASPRPVRFVMDEAFIASPVIRKVTRLFNTVTIRRDNPREAIKTAIEALKNGDLVCLFPEGQLTRTGTLSELRRGFELIARKSGLPVIPLWVDGSWGSIFSFERGVYFKKLPYRVPYGLSVAIGEPLANDQLDLPQIQRALLKTSAEAIGSRYGNLTDGLAHRSRVNAHQIGQLNALQRKQPIHVLKGDPTVDLVREFARRFHCRLVFHETFSASPRGVWVGAEKLRQEIGKAELIGKTTFYDFSGQALTPLRKNQLMHCPSLALEGVVVAMSMEMPPLPLPTSEPQLGAKPGTWGKLLPGWYVEDAGDSLILKGPAAPVGGIALPSGTVLDAEGMLGNFQEVL
ncbi:MAG: MFS transporter [Luteolibacter sp.]